MKQYGSRKSRRSTGGVLGYEYGNTWIAVKFRDRVYMYTNDSAGFEAIEEMKQLADAGTGLTRFIGSVVYTKYEERFLVSDYIECKQKPKSKQNTSTEEKVAQINLPHINPYSCIEKNAEIRNFCIPPNLETPAEYIQDSYSLEAQVNLITALLYDNIKKVEEALQQGALLTGITTEFIRSTKMAEFFC